MMRRFIKCFSILLLIVCLDQASKLWVYYHMEMGMEGQRTLLGNILKLTYTLNPGMACSIQLPFKYGKLCITLVRIIVPLLILRYVIQFLKQYKPTLWLWGWILVVGGAIGNGIDSVLYGVCLGNAPSDAPMQWFYGQVIDMIHIDLWSGIMPSWIPIWGDYYVYCLPIFNIADVAVCMGLLLILWGSSPDKAIEIKSKV